MKACFKPKLNMSVDGVNLLADSDPAGYIAACERRYNDDICTIASEIVSRHSRVVLVSGPSSSGKTTSSHLISREIGALGRRCAVVSLDNFFRNYEDYPEREDGEKDLESIYTIDLDEFHRCLDEIETTGVTEIPTFDFGARRRGVERIPIDVTDGGIVIMEGIHALNPMLAGDADGVIKLYAGLRLEYTAGDESLLQTRDIRIIRRIIRDYLFRHYSVEDTLGQWDNLKAGEYKWIKAFKGDADLLLDTSFAYEPCIYANAVERLFTENHHGGQYRTLFTELVDRLACFVPIDPDLVPADSMIREFIG